MDNNSSYMDNSSRMGMSSYMGSNSYRTGTYMSCSNCRGTSSCNRGTSSPGHFDASFEIPSLSHILVAVQLQWRKAIQVLIEEAISII